MFTERMAEISIWSSAQRKGCCWKMAGFWHTATSGNMSPLSLKTHLTGSAVYSLMFGTHVQSVFFTITPDRGGGEQGLSWQRQACVEGKPKSIEDLRACLLHLFSLGVSSPSLAALAACSAGAVPVGALCNAHPHMIRAVTLQVRYSV